jgi:hypothetical protein
MLFDQKFIDWVEENPIEGLAKACEITLAEHSEISDPNEWTEAEHELLWEASSFIQLVLEANNININVEFPSTSPNVDVNCKNLTDYISVVENEIRGKATLLKIQAYKSRYSAALKSSFAYEFSQGDLNRIQALINELRNLFAQNKELEEGHQRRLLSRLERLQAELHKRVSDLDRFWGLVGDAGVVLGKLGKDAKPIVERIKEVAEIVWKTQARAEELPSDSSNPMLECDDDA